jgi:uncharacterized membrane protein YbhN (UPF0104 family)
MAGQGGSAKWKKFLPWLGTALILIYLVTTTDLHTVTSALADINIWAVLALGFGGTLVTFFTDSYCVKLAFSRFVCPITYREALPIKATSYFLNILNYNLALVGMAFYLQRSKQAPFWKSLGSMFFLNVMDILGLCVLLTIGLLATWGTDTLTTATQLIAWVMVAGGVFGFALLVAMCKLNLRIPVLSRVLKLEMLAPFSELNVVLVLQFVALRILFLMQYLAAQYLFLRLFGVEIPVVRLLVYQPLLTFVQIIPISISGLGTTQVVMRHFYSPYVTAGTRHPAGIIDAFSTTSIFAFLFFRLLVAYLFLGDFSREVIKHAGQAEEGQ